MSFDPQPILESEILRLRPLRPEDFHDLYAVASDPLIWVHPIKDRYKEEVFKGFFREVLESGGALIAIDSKDGQVIGSSRFHVYDKEKSGIEIGWTFLARSHWDGSYNMEMKQLMLRHAFQFVNNVIFLVGPQNVRSLRAMEKIGAVSFGIKARRGRPRQFSLPTHCFSLIVSSLPQLVGCAELLRGTAEEAAAEIAREIRTKLLKLGELLRQELSKTANLLRFTDIPRPEDFQVLAEMPAFHMYRQDGFAKRLILGRLGRWFRVNSARHRPQVPESGLKLELESFSGLLYAWATSMAARTWNAASIILPIATVPVGVIAA